MRVRHIALLASLCALPACEAEDDRARFDLARYALTGPLPTSPDWAVDSNQSNAEMGTAVTVVGAVNGDGYADVAVGAPYYDNGQSNEGRVWLYKGSASGLNSSAAWTEEINSAGALFGMSLGGGDFNCDGKDDLVVGASGWSNGQTSEGRALVYYGNSSSLNSSHAWAIEGQQAYAELGYAVAGVGSVNGDSCDDVLVGAHYFDEGQTNEGKAYLYHGHSSGLPALPNWTGQGQQTDAYFAEAVAAAGDVNDDSYADVLIGARNFDNGQTNEGRAYLYFGGSGGLATAPSWLTEGNQTGANFGAAVAGADLNGDGCSDVIVGAPGYDNGQTDEGRVYVYLTSGNCSAAAFTLSPSWTTESNQAHASFGHAVAGAGDLTGDGYDELLVGSYRYDNPSTDEGRAWAWEGGSGGPSGSADWTEDLNQSYARFGWSISGGGDFDNDGFDDVVVGAPQWESTGGQGNEGSAWAYYGSWTDADDDGDPDYTDCDDNDDDTYNGAPEQCDGVDNDCDGQADYASDGDEDDSDGDGWLECPGYIENGGGFAGGGDCDDSRSAVRPDAAEVCDGVDTNCDDDVEFADSGGNELDDDGDNWLACNSYVDNGGGFNGAGDCDDSRTTVRPNAAEACDGIDTDCDGSTDYADANGDESDADGDNRLECSPYVENGGLFDGGLDCDDGNAAVYPSATESCDGLDEDCDGQAEFADVGGNELDSDGDTWLACASFVDHGGGYAGGGDCDDGSVTIRPGLPEACDGVDTNCSGAADFADATGDELDADSDGWVECAPYADNGGSLDGGDDCDDDDGDAWPGAPEVSGDGVDQDCDGDDLVLCYDDDDGDGYGGGVGVPEPTGLCDGAEVTTGGDCDDDDPTINPDGATVDVPDDTIDQDCSGADTVTCYQDLDQDDFGDSTNPSLEPDGDCDEPFIAAAPGDCSLADASIHPGAPEVADDGVDQDCNGADTVTCQVDLDGDDAGGADTLLSDDGDCSDAGEATDPDDCDDSDPFAWPGAAEILDDGVDQDCNGADSVSCFEDADGDGFGDAPLVAPDGDCSDDAGESPVDGDCDDAEPTAFPGGSEVPDDGIDQDCSGADEVTCYADADGDGFGVLAYWNFDPDGDCTDDPLQSPVGTDCDDTDPSIFPDAPETPDDGADSNCDGFDSTVCAPDVDGDGFGRAGSPLISVDDDCDDPGEAVSDTDCDDDDASAFPGADETVDDGIDQDCSGADTVTCLVDGDGDGFGGDVEVLSTDGDCTDDGEALHLAGGDCDDDDDDAYPGAEEVLDDAVDQDCNGFDSVLCGEDLDGDGYGGSGVAEHDDGDCTDDPNQSDNFDDCDDLDDQVHPGAAELCDDEDSDCDGSEVDEFPNLDGDGLPDCVDSDVDGDGYEGALLGNGADCDDGDPAISPVGVEVCNGVDDDCDPGTDEDADEDGDGASLCDGDCDLDNRTVHPAAEEVCDDGDQDCDGDLLAEWGDEDGDGLPDCPQTPSDGLAPAPGLSCSQGGDAPPTWLLLLVPALAALRRRS